jgi:hypothetical protein
LSEKVLVLGAIALVYIASFLIAAYTDRKIRRGDPGW